MSRIVSVVLCRPCSSSDVIPIAMGHSEFYDTEGTSTQKPMPSDSDVTSIVKNRIRTYFNNEGKIDVDGYVLHYLVVVESFCNMVYVCISEPGLSESDAQQFLENKIRAIMSSSQLQMIIQEARPYELLAHIQPMILKYIKEHNKSVSNDRDNRMDELRSQVNDVRNIMAQNVERIMERGERLENIEQRSVHLQSTAASFKSTARRVQRHFCQQNAKYTICVVLLVIIFVTGIVLTILHKSGKI